MPPAEELRSRLHELLALELSLQGYLRECAARVHHPMLRARFEQTASSIPPDADLLAKCLGLLGDRPQLGQDSLLLAALRAQDLGYLAESPQDADLRCTISLLALGHLRVSLYRSLLGLADAMWSFQVEEALRQLLARLEHDLSHLQASFDAVLAAPPGLTDLDAA